MKKPCTVKRIGMLVLLGACLLAAQGNLVLCQHPERTRVETGKREHANPMFGYRIALSEKLQVKTNSMMGPSSWFITLAAGSMREISIICGPDLTMRGSLEKAAKAKEDELDRVDTKELVEKRSVKIGEVSGILTKYRIGQPGELRLYENVTVYRLANPRGVIYNIGLWTDADNYVDDKRVFDEILASWHFTPLTPEATGAKG